MPASIDATARTRSFETFYEEHFRRLYTALFLVTGSRHEAEEIAQEAFLRVFERWDHVGGLEDPTGYIYRASMNLFRNRYRRAALALRRTLALAPSQTDELAEIETRDELVRLVRELTPHQRAAVLLTAICDLSADEAGRIMGVQGSTVRSLSSRARSAMKSKVVDQG